MKATTTLKKTLAVLLALVTIMTASGAFGAAAAKSVTSLKITVSQYNVYTGKALQPAVSVKNGSTTLKKGTHYTLKYSSNTNIGVGYVTVTGVSKGGYTGSKKLSYYIVPAKVTGVKVSAKTYDSVTLKYNASKGATKYRVYQYNSSTKKYTLKVTSTSTTAKVTGLKPSTSYKFAVAAYKTVKSKDYFGSKSALVTVKTDAKVTVGKVNDLTVIATTASTVSLTWTAASKAKTYSVYRYFPSTGNYTLLKFGVTGTSVKLTYLPCSTKYYLCVCGVSGSSSGPKSANVIAATKSADYLTKWKRFIEAGKFTIKYSMTDKELGKVTLTTVLKGDSVSNTMSYSGIKAQMIYRAGDAKAYAMVKDFRLYDEISKDNLDEYGLSASVVKQSFLAPYTDTVEITESNATVSGKLYRVYSYASVNGITAKYYFYGPTLKIIKNIDRNGAETTINITSYTDEVASNAFKLPSGFPTLWIKADIF